MRKLTIKGMRVTCDEMRLIVDEPFYLKGHRFSVEVWRSLREGKFPVGSRYYLREQWCNTSGHDSYVVRREHERAGGTTLSPIIYRADFLRRNEDDLGVLWRPSNTMPKWAARFCAVVMASKQCVTEEPGQTLLLDITRWSIERERQVRL